MATNDQPSVYSLDMPPPVRQTADSQSVLGVWVRLGGAGGKAVASEHAHKICSPTQRGVPPATRSVGGWFLHWSVRATPFS